MSSEKKHQGPPDNLPRKKVNDDAAAKVKGGVEPVNGRPKPAEPPSDRTTK